MPNGGSDCCLTCWFNEKNKGEIGYDHADDPERDRCVIRDLDIDGPAYTYCANHPWRNKEKVRVPIGPVYKGDSSGERWIWTEAPNTEEVRAALLEMLPKFGEDSETEYPIGLHLEEIVVEQLGRLCEQRAVPELQRISKLDPERLDGFGRSRARTVALAKWALNQLGS